MNPWFARVDLSTASKAQQRVVQRVCDLLDQLDPAELDPARQTVEPEGGVTWVNLQHASEPWLTIRFVISDGWVNFYGVMGHDETYSVHPEPRDGWETDTIDMLADLLQATYSLDTYTLRGKPWREVLTISAPYDRAFTELQSPAAALPLARWAQHSGPRTATFRCRGTRSSTT